VSSTNGFSDEQISACYSILRTFSLTAIRQESLALS